MQLRKPAVITLGVTAGLVALAPFASAHQSHHDGDRPAPAPSSTCSAQGGTATAANGGEGGGLLANVVAQAPIGGANVGNILCNSILNDNLSRNLVLLDLL
ncbi:hypothetical protein [Actinomycetospora sp. CA-084318]|uniref:hypothetical protein n=1 Tax=Actinomycetospora sp. CA-084318 TaxID=3239892 RepID=UPI003D971430